MGIWDRQKRLREAIVVYLGQIGGEMHFSTGNRVGIAFRRVLIDRVPEIPNTQDVSNAVFRLKETGLVETDKATPRSRIEAVRLTTVGWGEYKRVMVENPGAGLLAESPLPSETEPIEATRQVYTKVEVVDQDQDERIAREILKVVGEKLTGEDEHVRQVDELIARLKDAGQEILDLKGELEEANKMNAQLLEENMALRQGALTLEPRTRVGIGGFVKGERGSRFSNQNRKTS